MKCFYPLILFLFSTSFLIAQPFVDMAPTFGITEYYGPVQGGGGLSWVDFNGDGWDDLTATTQSGFGLNFYENTAGVLAKIDPLVDVSCESRQVIWVDYDNDGDKDLFVTCYEERNLLFENTGNMVFSDVTTAAGFTTDLDPTYGASFGDYNRDGWLDVYVCNYSIPPADFNNYLMISNGDKTFTEALPAVGCNTPTNLSFQSVFFDYNNDLDPDIYMAVDMGFANILFKNKGDGTFEDVSESSGSDIVINAMNAGAGDYDGDGDLDIYVTNTNTAPGNVLLRNNGDGTFENMEMDMACGTDYYHTSWAGNWVDIDNDTDLDLYVSSIGLGSTNNALFVNDGPCNFTFYNGNYSGNAKSSYVNAIGDFNQDGLVDLAVSQAGIDPYLVLENQNTTTNNWIKILLEGTTSNKDGIGSWIEVYAGGNKYVRFTKSGEGYLNQNTLTYHFGLGTNTVVDVVKVLWPSGTVDEYTLVAVNNTYIVEEGNPVIALPVTLKKFNSSKVDEQTVMLSWSTVSETNSDYFEVERSRDARSFKVIGKVAAKGFSDSEEKYSFEDVNHEKASQYYYRLKMVDQDESYEYSRTVNEQFTFKDAAKVNMIYPNPARGEECFIQLEGFDNQTGQVYIYNQIGHQVSAQTINIIQGVNDIAINIEHLVDGAYFVVLEVEEKKIYNKLIVY